jgi:glycosyltransferase involved in cell wall biosynthesis
MTIDAVVPARDEAPTVADVVMACRGCKFVREVLVVDDGSSDDTSERAAAAGAKVIRLDPGGSKAHAMEAGVAATDADAVLFVDADCLGLSSAHLDDICQPFADGRAVMSLGTFDYGIWNPLVLRMPHTTGERVIPRWVFETIPPEKLDGYTIETVINEVVASRHLKTSVRVMKGVSHRTKRDKFGLVKGWQLTWKMFWALVRLPLRGVVRGRYYLNYLRSLSVEK